MSEPINLFICPMCNKHWSDNDDALRSTEQTIYSGIVCPMCYGDSPSWPAIRFYDDFELWLVELNNAAT